MRPRSEEGMEHSSLGSRPCTSRVKIYLISNPEGRPVTAGVCYLAALVSLNKTPLEKHHYIILCCVTFVLPLRLCPLSKVLGPQVLGEVSSIEVVLFVYGCTCVCVCV